MSKFGELVGKLEKEGDSEGYATKIAAKVGDEKYGKEAMAKKAAAAREGRLRESAQKLRESMFPHLRRKQ